MAASSALDLHDIATLVNYERATTEPRFRRTKLRECSIRPDGQLAFSTVQFQSALQLTESTPVRGFVFDQVPQDEDEPDLPTNMVPDPPEHPSVSELTERDLDDIYWEVRGHDGCFKCIGILQHFFDLFPGSRALRVRTADGEDFLTTVSHRTILEYELQSPVQTTLATVFPANLTYTTGNQYTNLHAVWGFSRPGDDGASITLDLASMQYGVKGRGLGGESFMLGSVVNFHLFLGSVCRDVKPPKISARIAPSSEDTLFKDVAKRVKERWDKRETNPWCGHCGAPLSILHNCPCKGVHYCGPAHQKAAWRFHRKHCAARKKK